MLRFPTVRPAALTGALLALGSGLALAALASALDEPTARAETAYLALWVTAVLLPAGLALPRAPFAIGLAGLAVELAAWLLPTGPQRGAAVALVLAGGLALATAQGLEPRAFTVRSPRLPLLALAMAGLFSSGLALQPQLGTVLLTALAPAWLTGMAAASLAETRAWTGLLTAAAVIVAAGGPGWFAAIALAALAVGEQTRLGRLRLSVSLPLLVCAVLPLRDQPLAACGVVAAGAALAWPRPAVRLALSGLMLAAALLPDPTHPASLGLLVAMIPLVPLVPLAASHSTEREGALAACLLSALVAWVGGDAALPAAAGLAVLASAPRGAALRLQAGWTGWLLAASALAAAYPWLRGEPTSSALALWSLPTTASGYGLLALLAPLLVGAAAIALGSAPGPLGEATSRRFAPLLPALALLALAVRAPARPLLGAQPVVLDQGRSAWTSATEQGPIAVVVVEAALSNSTALPDGAAVASVRLRSADGHVEERPLRVGHELDEWAARRPDVAATRPSSANAWTSWVPPGGGFFAQRYRARLAFSPAMATEVEIRRLDSVPASLALALYRVEVER